MRLSSVIKAENRVLVVAPVGADAANIKAVLAEAGFLVEVCRDILVASQALVSGCGAMVLTQEAIDIFHHPQLALQLNRQPPWSDVPIVLITTGGRLYALSERAVELIEARANLTLIERPLRTSTLVSAVKAAMRARFRQYEIRDLIADRERLLASLEKRVAERTARLQAMVEELEAFSYSVSHDLRAPLRVLDGYAQALIEDHGASLQPDAKDMLDRIARTARRMDRLTQDVLAYTRVSRAELALEPVDLDVMVSTVIEQYPSLMASRHLIGLRTPLGVVLGHGPSLLQCFSNLLENALKFVRPGETPRVEIYSENREDRVRVFVQDWGPGIDPMHQERVFNMFERAGALKNVPGTGIGLAIVKKAVERMGGSVGVVSELGQGARFWIDLAKAHPPGELQA